jgi:hypothetical protein
MCEYYKALNHEKQGGFPKRMQETKLARENMIKPDPRISTRINSNLPDRVSLVGLAADHQKNLTAIDINTTPQKSTRIR